MKLKVTKLSLQNAKEKSILRSYVKKKREQKENQKLA